jgi:SAM-dependent methyltransferase
VTNDEARGVTANTEDDRLYSDPALVQFYDLENEWAADQAYCAGLAREAASVLDLGCGTGLFLATLAQKQPGKTLTGADPAAAMLAVARVRPGGDRVRWVEADARTLRLDRKFDLIVLTGHAFQVFLTEADRRALLASIAHHLVPKGRFVFDTRNPLVADWRTWTPDESRRVVRHPEFGAVEAWNDVALDAATGVVTYWTHYRVQASGKHLSAESKIAFPSKAELETLIAEAGLQVERWLGDWHGAPFGDTMPEIIPVGRLE